MIRVIFTDGSRKEFDYPRVTHEVGPAGELIIKERLTDVKHVFAPGVWQEVVPEP